MTEKPKYSINRRDLAKVEHRPARDGNTGSLVASALHGSQTSWLFVERSPGYRSEPHYHEAEQINYFVSGDFWLFVEEHGYRCRAGDIIRIPPGKWHWAVNLSDETAVVIETHSPPSLNPEIRMKAAALLGPDEDPAAVKHDASVLTGFPGDTAAIEARAFAEAGL